MKEWWLTQPFATVKVHWQHIKTRAAAQRNAPTVYVPTGHSKRFIL
jgi:hypothetical protein